MYGHATTLRHLAAYDMTRWDEMDLYFNPQRLPCARCGQVAMGYAKIKGKRYCHPSNPRRQDCYQLALRYRYEESA